MGDTIGIPDLSIEPGGDEVTEYIRENHYTGTCNPISNKWKIVHETDDGSEIVGAIVFANPMSEQVREFIAGSGNERQVTELHRLYTDDDCGKNVESWFIANALSALKKKKPKYRFVVSYADETEGHEGTIYKATNAWFTGKAQERKFYRDQDGNLRSPREAGENVTLADADERGWTVEKRETKFRYVFPLPDPYESREDVRDDLACETMPYPDSDCTE